MTELRSVSGEHIFQTSTSAQPDKIDLEVKLLEDIRKGFLNQAKDSVANPKHTAVELGGSMLAGVMLGSASYELAPVATLVGYAFKAGLAIDIGRRGWQVGSAMYSVWNDPLQFDKRSEEMQKLGGAMCSDALLFAGSYAGMRLSQMAFDRNLVKQVIVSKFPENTVGIPKVQPGIFRPTLSFEEPDSDFGQIYQRKHAAIGRVVGDKWKGTAFYVDQEGLWATNTHVVAGQGNLKVFNGGKAYPAEVVAIDRKADLALLKTEPIDALEPLSSAVGRQSIMQRGKKLGIIGHPLSADSDILTTGSAENIIAMAEGFGARRQVISNIAMDAGAYPGSSGSPMLSDHGEVLGIVKAGAPFNTGTLATNAGHLDSLIAATKIRPPQAGSLLDVRTTLISQPKSQLIEKPVYGVSNISEMSTIKLATERELLPVKYGMNALAPIGTVWAGGLTLASNVDVLGMTLHRKRQPLQPEGDTTGGTAG